MRYNRLFALKAQKAIETGLLDVESFVSELIEEGVPPEEIERLLLDDLDMDGPIFGKLFRSLGMAGDMAISSAELQGSAAGEALTLDEELRLWATAAETGQRPIMELLDEGDPDALQAIENVTELEAVTWVCTLRNTCAKCLPLHGKTLTKREWRMRGLVPRTIHYGCQCDWVTASVAANRIELVDPLIRTKVPGSKRTVRTIATADIDRARAEAARISQTEEGRKTLARLGSANK